MFDLEKLAALKKALKNYEQARVTRNGLAGAKTALVNMLLNNAAAMLDEIAQGSEKQERLMEQIDALETLAMNQKKQIDELKAAEAKED